MRGLLKCVYAEQGRNDGGKNYVGAEKSQQCHKYFPQHSTFASERPQGPPWGRGTKLLSCLGRHRLRR